MPRQVLGKHMVDTTRLAIITGGSRGLGRALCEQFLARGFQVIEFSRTAPHAYSVRVDLASPESCRAAVAHAIASVDLKTLQELVVVNNAGTLDPIGASSQKPSAAVLANLNINFTSAIMVLAELTAKFQSAPCRKVLANISSGAAQRGLAGWSLYCASKSGMEAYIRALAIEQEGEPHPFTAININPGVIDTEMQAMIRASSAADFPDVDRFQQRKEQGALAAPADVAAAVLRIVASPALVGGGRYEAGG
jgi:benzil reductase ((S)-benzoin forming)